MRIAAIAFVICILAAGAATASAPSSSAAPRLDPNVSFKATFVTETKKVLVAVRKLKAAVTSNPNSLLELAGTYVLLRGAAATLRQRAAAAEAALRAERPTSRQYQQARAAAISAMALLKRAADGYADFASALLDFPLAVGYDLYDYLVFFYTGVEGQAREQVFKRLHADALRAVQSMAKAKAALTRANARLGAPFGGAKVAAVAPKPLDKQTPLLPPGTAAALNCKAMLVTISGKPGVGGTLTVSPGKDGQGRAVLVANGSITGADGGGKRGRAVKYRWTEAGKDPDSGNPADHFVGRGIISTQEGRPEYSDSPTTLKNEFATYVKYALKAPRPWTITVEVAAYTDLGLPKSTVIRGTCK